MIKFSNIVILLLIGIIINDSLRYMAWFMPGIVQSLFSFSNFILVYCSLIIFLFFALKSKSIKNVPSLIITLFICWVGWNLVNILRGVFLASNYWDWKFLLSHSIGFTIIPLAFFIGTSLVFYKKVIDVFISYILPIGFLFIPLSFISNKQLYARVMAPISLLILLIPFLKKKKYQTLIIIVTLTTVFMSFDIRSSLIKIIFSIILLTLYFSKKLIQRNHLLIMHNIMFFCPIILLALAIRGDYNIFEEMNSKAENKLIENERLEQDDLLKDSRTFLYLEVFDTLKDSNNWILGVSASKPYNSVWFYNDGGAIKGKRWNTEVNFLNIILHLGIIGIIIYFSLVYIITYYAIFKSQNFLSKLLGFFISFRWTYSFIEEYTQFDLNFFFFWLTLGFISNENLRKLSDNQVQYYLNH